MENQGKKLGLLEPKRLKEKFLVVDTVVCHSGPPRLKGISCLGCCWMMTLSFQPCAGITLHWKRHLSAPSWSRPYQMTSPCRVWRLSSFVPNRDNTEGPSNYWPAHGSWPNYWLRLHHSPASPLPNPASFFSLPEVMILRPLLISLLDANLDFRVGFSGN